MYNRRSFYPVTPKRGPNRTSKKGKFHVENTAKQTVLSKCVAELIHLNCDTAGVLLVYEESMFQYPIRSSFK